MVCADNTACSGDATSGLELLTDASTSSVYAAVAADEVTTAAGTVNLAATGT
jgi:hypothetical protein